MFPYYFIRFSGPILFILIGMKILSGYALTGKLDNISWLARLHENRALDLFLLVLFIFHACYGLRLFLIDLGMAKKENLLFWLFTVIGLTLCSLSYLWFF